MDVINVWMISFRNLKVIHTYYNKALHRLYSVMNSVLNRLLTSFLGINHLIHLRFQWNLSELEYITRVWIVFPHWVSVKLYIMRDANTEILMKGLRYCGMLEIPLTRNSWKKWRRWRGRKKSLDGGVVPSSPWTRLVRILLHLIYYLQAIYTVFTFTNGTAAHLHRVGWTE